MIFVEVNFSTGFWGLKWRRIMCIMDYFYAVLCLFDGQE